MGLANFLGHAGGHGVDGVLGPRYFTYKWVCLVLLLMEQILHHLGCIKPSK